MQDNPELITDGVELVDILTASQLSATVRKALLQSTKHTAKKSKIKSEPTNANFLPPPEPQLPSPLHINVHHNNTQPMTSIIKSEQSPSQFFTINKTKTFPEVSSPPQTPSPPMKNVLPTTVFQHLSPNLPSFHKQLPQPTTSIQQELFANQSVIFKTESESDDEIPIKSEPVSPVRLAAPSPDLPNPPTIPVSPIISAIIPSSSGNSVPNSNSPLITVQVIKHSPSLPQPIKVETVPEPPPPTIFQIKSEMPTISSSYTSPPVTIHMPQYGGTVKAATLSDLEGIDMMHLPVDLDDSGNIDLLNEIDVEEMETIDTKPDLLSDTHSSFFTLIREIFCSTINHRTTIEHLESKITGWLASPITALNDWYIEAENWVTLIPSAIQFLAGEFLDQPEDFVPYVEYKPQLLIYQWIGAGRDSDQHLNPLCDFWLQRRNEIGVSNCSSQSGMSHQTEAVPRIAKSNTSCSTESEDLFGSNINSTERLSSPLPPRCPTGWTVVKANEQEIEEFREQERKRFENPHLSFTYRLHGFESVVGPVKGIYTQIPVISKARGHNMLTVDRPTFVTILTLVRDATARLPNGEGTRSEICELLRSSQYINPDAADSVLQTIVSGALDRMHTEHDPCVRYDPKRKIWIYLHRNRSEEEFEKMHQQFQGVSKHKKQSGRKLKSKSLIKSPVVSSGIRPSNSFSPVTSKVNVPANVLPVPSIAMLPPSPIISTPLVSTPLLLPTVVSSSIATVHSPQPQLKASNPPLNQVISPSLPTPIQPLVSISTPLQATIQPLVTTHTSVAPLVVSNPSPIPITTTLQNITSPLQIQQRQPQLSQSQSIINKLAAPKKSVIKQEISSIKSNTNVNKIDKTERLGAIEATLDGQNIPIMIGKAKLSPGTNQPTMVQNIITQRITNSNLDNKIIPTIKPTRVIIPSNSLLNTSVVQQTPPPAAAQSHVISHVVQSHVIPQAKQRITQINSPTMKIAQQPPVAQVPQTSLSAVSSKSTYTTNISSTMSLSNITSKPSFIKTAIIQPPNTTTMPVQPQQSVLIQNQNNRVPTQMFVPTNTIATTSRKLIKPPPLVQHQQKLAQQQPQQTSSQNFMIPINITTQSIVQQHKVTTSLANHQSTNQIHHAKTILRTTSVSVLNSTNPKPGMSLLQQNQPSKSVVRASPISSGKSLITPSAATANISFQQQQQQNLQKIQRKLPANIVSIQGRPTVQPVIIPKMVSAPITTTTTKGQPTTLTPVQQRQILHNIIAQQKLQRSNSAGNSINLVPSTVVVSTPNSQHQQSLMKNVIVSQQNTNNFMHRIIASSAATSMIITSAVSQPTTITTIASSGLTTKPTSTSMSSVSGTSLINRQIIQIQQNNNSQQSQPKHPTSGNAALGKVQTVSTSNLTPQQQQNLLQSIKQQQMRVQNQQANATPQQQSLMVKQQQVLQQIQKQLQHQQNTTINPGTSLLNQSTGTIISSISSATVSATSTPVSSINSITNIVPQSVTRIIRPGIIRQPPFIQTVSSTPNTSTTSTMPATMTKVLSNTTGQIISLESLLQKQGQSIGSGTTLRVAGTKPGQANIIQLAGSSGSPMTQYAIVSQGPQGRSMISLTSTPQRLVNAQGIPTTTTTTTSSTSSIGGTTLLKSISENKTIRSTNSASTLSIVQQSTKPLVQQLPIPKPMGIQSVTAGGAARFRSNTTAIRMMNTSNLNIAHIAGKPVIISGGKTNGPTQLLPQTSRQNVVWQNPTSQNNTPASKSNSNFVISDQSAKAHVLQNFDQQSDTSRISGTPQAVMFGNQVVKLQTNMVNVSQTQQSSPAQPPKSTTQPNPSFIHQSGTTRTVVLGQTGQTIRVHSPAQPPGTSATASSSNMQGLVTMSMAQPNQHVSVGQGIKVLHF